MSVGFTRIFESLGELQQKTVGVIAIFGLGFLAYLSTVSLGPVILQDEMIYSFEARLLNLQDRSFPNHFYYLLFGATELCGPASYSCAKGLNFFLLSTMALTIFLAGWRRSPLTAFVLALALLILPSSLYVSFFMPEILAAVLIFFTAVATVKLPTKYAITTPLVLGLLVALATMVKVQLLFLVAPIMAVLWIRMGGVGSIVRAARSVGIFIASVVILRFVVGYLLAGEAGLSFLGNSYGQAFLRIIETLLARGLLSPISYSAAAETSLTVGSADSSFLANTFREYGQYLYGSFSAFGVLIVGLVAGLLISNKQRENHSDLEPRNWAIFALFSLITLMIVIPLFTAAISLGDDHSERVLLRYAEPVTPVLLVGSILIIKSIASRKIFVILGLSAFAQVIASLFWPFKGVFADSAILSSVTQSPLHAILWPLALYCLILLVGMPRGSNFLALTISVSVILPMIFLWQDALGRISSLSDGNSPDQSAAKVVSGLSPDGEGVHFLGSSKTELLRSVLKEDLVFASFGVFEPGASVSEGKVPDGTEWIISTQEVVYNGPRSYDISGPGFTISRIETGQHHYFGKDMANDFVNSLEGFETGSAGLGQWIVGSQAYVNLHEPLPAGSYELGLQFYCSVDCREQVFAVQLGNGSIPVTGVESGKLASVTFEFTSTIPIFQMGILMEDGFSSRQVAFRYLKVDQK